MRHTYHRTSDDAQVSEAEAIDARGVLRPGHRMTTPVMLQDGAMPPITDEARYAAMDARDAALSNAWRNPSAQFRDGAQEVQQRDTALSKIEDAYERRDRWLENAWR